MINNRTKIKFESCEVMFFVFSAGGGEKFLEEENWAKNVPGTFNYFVDATRKWGLGGIESAEFRIEKCRGRLYNLETERRVNRRTLERAKVDGAGNCLPRTELITIQIL
jgi:hypothetical protein